MYQWKQTQLSTIDARCKVLWERLLNNQDAYGVSYYKLPCGAQVIDAGVNVRGSFEAGLILAEIGQGGMAKANLGTTSVCGVYLPEIHVESFAPAVGCLDIQMGTPVTGSILSGPVRLMIEPLRFVDADIPLRSAENAMLALLEPYNNSGIGHDTEIDNALAMEISELAGIRPDQLRMVIAYADSIAGVTQVCGRVNEDVTLTIGRALEWDPRKIVHMHGRSPICPIYRRSENQLPLGADDFLHYAGEVFLTWDGDPDDDLDWLAQQLVFETLEENGCYFEDLLEAANWDFWQIPNVTFLNRIARITINDINTGRIHTCGTPQQEILAARMK